MRLCRPLLTRGGEKVRAAARKCYRRGRAMLTDKICAGFRPDASSERLFGAVNGPLGTPCLTFEPNGFALSIWFLVARWWRPDASISRRGEVASSSPSSWDDWLMSDCCSGSGCCCCCCCWRDCGKTLPERRGRGGATWCRSSLLPFASLGSASSADRRFSVERCSETAKKADVMRS